MGQENEKGKKDVFKPFTVNKDLVLLAKPNAIVMHCLPAHKGEEITEDVFEQYSDVIFNQAENRLHVQKSLMSFLFKK
jgi:ornithine carbamoyltransferase